MEVIQNILYVMTQGAYVHRDHLALQVRVEDQVRIAVPIHNVQGLVLFGQVLVSPGALELCAETGASVCFMTEQGRLQARVDAPVSGNVLLRREQFRQADCPETTLMHARSFVAGKIANARANLLRAARDGAAPEDREALLAASAQVGKLLPHVPACTTLDELRGSEGMAARYYFQAFPHLVRQQRADFAPQGRTRRPPLDRGNALLSFIYALLLSDCVAALTCAGLDPNVGFLHADRPGRPSLALDLMEEFRPLLADRLMLTLVNRRQLAAADFRIRDGGGVEMSPESRRSVIAAWQERKQEQVTHPLLDIATRVGQLTYLQARLLARAIRGELPAYVPCQLK
jgi:CRISP-associated protein Cas1